MTNESIWFAISSGLIGLTLSVFETSLCIFWQLPYQEFHLCLPLNSRRAYPIKYWLAFGLIKISIKLPNFGLKDFEQLLEKVSSSCGKLVLPN